MRDRVTELPKTYGRYVLILVIGGLVEIIPGTRKRGGRAFKVEN